MGDEQLIRMIKDREGKLTEIQAEIAPLREKAKALEVEINVLKEANSKISGSLEKKSTKKTRERALQPHWNETLLFIGRKGKANLDDINRFMTQHLQKDLGEDTQRSQLANYATRGWLERISEGTYTLTESGAQKCGYAEKKEGSSAVTQEPSQNLMGMPGQGEGASYPTAAGSSPAISTNNQTPSSGLMQTGGVYGTNPSD